MKLKVQDYLRDKHRELWITIGFTGTRKLPTKAQKHRLFDFLKTFYTKNGEFHHGDCIGSDREAHYMAYVIGYKIIIHPPEDAKYRAFCYKSRKHKQVKEKPYIERNHDIVDASKLLIATPQGAEILRSGTWATVRYARKQGKKIYLIYPDGNLVIENNTGEKK